MFGELEARDKLLHTDLGTVTTVEIWWFKYLSGLTKTIIVYTKLEYRQTSRHLSGHFVMLSSGQPQCSHRLSTTVVGD